MKTYRIGIIGCWGHYGFIESVSEQRKNHLQVVAISSGSDDESELKTLKNSFRSDSPVCYDSYQALLKKADIDIAIISPQFYKNKEIAQACLEYSIPAFLEKPFSTSLEELSQLDDVYRNTYTSLFPMFNMRYEPSFFTARDLVQSGKLGDLVLITAQKSYKLGTRPAFYKQRSSYGGTIPWVGIHAIDFIRFITGVEYTSVFAQHTTFANQNHDELESGALIVLSTQQKSLVEINVDYMRPPGARTHGDDRIRIAGSKGVLEIMNNALTWIDSHGEKEVPCHLPQYPIFEDFLQQLENISHNPLTCAEDGFYATKVALKARESADTHTIISI